MPQSFGILHKNKNHPLLVMHQQPLFSLQNLLDAMEMGEQFLHQISYYMKKIVSIRVHGSGTDKYDNIRNGINGRLDTALQAAVLLQKLKIFDDELKSRYKNYILYKKYCEGFHIQYKNIK